MDFGIAGKVALVSGGTQGMGLATAQALLDEGVNVAIFSRNQENIDSALAKLQPKNSEIIGLQGDLLDDASIENVVSEIKTRLGSIDIFIGNSGSPARSKAFGLTKDSMLLALQNNFVGLAALTNKLLPDMQSKKWGRIVYVTTSGVIQPIPNLAHSNTSRSALTSFAKTLSEEIAIDGITVNTVIPGKINTDHLEKHTRGQAADKGRTYDEEKNIALADIPAQRYGSPEEIANIITFLCSQPASYVTGVKIPVDGGMIKSV